MGKKINKLLSAALFAAAGAYAYKTYSEYKKVKDTSNSEDSEFEEEKGTTKDVVDFFKEKKDEFLASREYVTLNEKAKTAKDILIKTVTEAAEKFAEKAEEAKDGVGVVADDEKDAAEDFEFEDFDSEDVPEEEEVAEDVKEESDDDFEENFDEDMIIDEM